MLQYYVAFLPLLLFAVFALLLFAKKWLDDQRWAKTTTERVLRSAGDSRKEEMKRFDKVINDSLMYIGIGVAIQIIAFTFCITLMSGAVQTYLISIVSAATISFTLWHLVRTAFFISKRKKSSDGYLAERMTGEYMKALMLDGYLVFHDLQFEKFNIDHAAVGPAGVFAFETRFRAIPKSLKSEPVARFDGEKIKWPNGKSNELGMQETSDRAITLKQYLTSALGGNMEVQPVLVFPGWHVEVFKKGRVDIMSPKHIRAYLKGVEKYNEGIATNLINRVGKLLAEVAGYPEPKTEMVKESETGKQTATHAPMPIGN